MVWYGMVYSSMLLPMKSTDHMLNGSTDQRINGPLDQRTIGSTDLLLTFGSFFPSKLPTIPPEVSFVAADSSRFPPKLIPRRPRGANFFGLARPGSPPSPSSTPSPPSPPSPSSPPSAPPPIGVKGECERVVVPGSWSRSVVVTRVQWYDELSLNYIFY